MKKLFIIAALMLASSFAQADQCEDLAQRASQSTSNMSEALNRKYAIQTYNSLCNGGQQQQQQPETRQQYVPSIGKTCTIINGQITECWN